MINGLDIYYSKNIGRGLRLVVLLLLLIIIIINK